MFALFAAFAVGSLAGKPARPYHERVVFAQSQRVGAVKSPSKFKVSTMAARMYYWEQSVERCLKSPWVGRGPDALLNDITYVMPHAHNVLIGVAVDYGIPAGVSALAVFALAFWRGIVAVLKNALPTCPDCMAAAATFSAFAVAFFDYSFDSFIWAPQLWVLLGVFLAATRVDLHMRLGVLVGPETGSRHCRPSAD
jgi:O-antigen ligase